MKDRSWVKRMGQEVGAELSRLGRHGSLELANGLWNGNAFVPYGPGSRTEQGQGVHGPQAQEQPKEGQEQQPQGQGQSQQRDEGRSR